MIHLVILAIAGILAAAGLSFFVFAIIEVARILMVIFVIPLFAKFFADYIGDEVLGLGRSYGLVLGFAASIPLAIVLYMNFWALLIGTAILAVIYMLVRVYVPLPEVKR